MLGPKGLDRICEIIKVMVPFVRANIPFFLPPPPTVFSLPITPLLILCLQITYLNSVVMPDEADEEENDDADGVEEGDLREEEVGNEDEDEEEE